MSLRIALFITLFVAWPLITRAQMVVTSWTPIFKGIDHAIGTNYPDTTIPRLQVVNCVRVDLTDSDIELFTTPRATNYIADNTETYTTTVSNFLKRHNLKVAINANFYWSFCCGGSNPTADGVASAVYGYSVSTGQVVSLPDGPPPNDNNKRGASLLFNVYKDPSFIFDNYTAGPYTNGIHTAVTGYYPVLTNGVNIGDWAVTAYPDGSFHNEQPRTAFGVSEDRRYLFLMTIDGRQQNYSLGALDREIAMWFLQFGAWDGIVMDGGGSTAMYRANCAGNPVPLNRSSFPFTGVNPPRERYIGSHFGVRAKALDSFIADLSTAGGTTTAIISWTTPTNATSQVEYGLTPNYGTLSPLDSTLVTNHTVELSGLTPGRVYYYRVLSVVDGTSHSSPCPNTFQTTNFGGGLLFDLTANWKYSTSNLDGVNWQALGYNDASWPSGPAPMWVDTRIFQNRGIPNLQSETSGTKLPIDEATTFPFITYYFRARFIYTNTLSGLTLTFSNYIDDGAVFYLNGHEIYRTNLPSGPVSNSTLTLSSVPTATSPVLFSLTGGALSNLVAGTNLVAVELHNVTANSPDMTFEGALMYTLPPPPPPFIANVNVLPGETDATITWTTRSNSTSQILYGLTPAFGSSTPLDTNRVSNHAMVITGLQPLTQYYFRLVSSNGPSQEIYDGTLTTVPLVVPLVTFSNVWKFSTYNLDGVNWMARDYDDSAWEGEGPALLYIENNSDVVPRSTPLPSASGLPFPTYSFRTHFNMPSSPAGFALVFSNFIDDGAVFYLNGSEIARVRMEPAPAPVVNSTFATACPPNGCDATFETPDMFRIGGDAMTNLVAGDNVLAAEVHQQGSASSDIVFGAAVALVRATAGETKLHISVTNSAPCVFWDGEFLTLQHASVFTGSNVWSDVPGPVRSSPYCITNPLSTTFYRLRD